LTCKSPLQEFAMNQTRLLLRGTAVGLLTTAMALSAAAEETFSTDHYEVQIERLASVEHPWGLAFLPDGRYLVTERNAGTIRIGDRDGNLSPPISGTPEVFRYAGPTDRSQGGMFHVALHPDFAENGYVYWSFSEPSDEGAGTAIARGILVGEGDAPAFEGVEVIYTMNKHDSSGLHFGGRFAFHPEDTSIYLSVGERRNISRAQDGEDHAGSIIRVMDDGSTPDDNPHLDDDAVDDLIYAIGIRNIQALAFHPETNDLWAADHGPQGGDEINRIEAGENYGWPFQTGGVDYSGAPLGEGEEVEGMAAPVHIFEETVAPSGLLFYDGEMFPEWQGHMLIGGLTARALVRVELGENGDEVAEEEWMLQDLDRRIRDVAVDDDGAIWILTEHEDGEVIRLTNADGES
jgi:aldose sugar dehydrogenase